MHKRKISDMGKLLDSLKEYFRTATEEEKNQFDYLNDIGMSVDEYVESLPKCSNCGNVMFVDNDSLVDNMTCEPSNLVRWKCPKCNCEKV